MASQEVLYKEKHSKFFGYAFPVNSEDDIKNSLDSIKQKHRSARHWCYAWQLGTDKIQYRVNDDGEPNNSAGQPIYGQIQSFELTNILVVVVRYFGGVKLGVGGLISAYRSTAQMALSTSGIIEKTIDEIFLISFDYPNMDKVMRIIKEKKLRIVNQKMDLQCEISVSVRKKDAQKVFSAFKSIHGINITKSKD